MLANLIIILNTVKCLVKDFKSQSKVQCKFTRIAKFQRNILGHFWLLIENFKFTPIFARQPDWVELLYLDLGYLTTVCVVKSWHVTHTGVYSVQRCLADNKCGGEWWGPNLCIGMSESVFQGLITLMACCPHYTSPKNNNLTVVWNQICDLLKVLRKNPI